MKAAIQKVAVLMGGHSAERDISLASGTAVCASLRRQGLAHQAIDPADPGWRDVLQSARPDVVFLALHGPGGEDGTMQGFLATLGLAYTGSGVLASALAMDKLRTKQLWVGAGLPTPPHEVLREETDWSAVLARLDGEAIVKPACEGSSLGMARARDAAALKAAWEDAREYGADVFAEGWVAGEEYTVAVLGGVALPVIRLEVPGEFYDFEAKYRSDRTRYHIPSGLAPEDEQALQQLALDAFHSLACRGWGRVDVMRGAQGRFQLLEVNTIPGMTDHSLVPMAAEAAGLDFDALVRAILEQVPDTGGNGS